MTTHSISPHSPVGIFDSGVGGLTVAKEIFRLLPAEQVVYFGDVGRTPYGGRSREIITQFSHQDVRFLIEQEVKYIICACNTVSAVALEDLQQVYAIPMIGVIRPGAEAAVRMTKNRRIGVIGTVATISSDTYAKTIQEIAPDINVSSLACPLFVPLAEEGYISKEATRLIAQDYLAPLVRMQIDTLILGCTHYPILRDVIQSVVGPEVTLIDSGEETARVAQSALVKSQLVTDEKQPGTHRFYVSDVPERFSQVATRFLGQVVDGITRVDITRF